jgi:hypothetical protein
MLVYSVVVVLVVYDVSCKLPCFVSSWCERHHPSWHQLDSWPHSDQPAANPFLATDSNTIAVSLPVNATLIILSVNTNASRYATTTWLTAA